MYQRYSVHDQPDEKSAIVEHLICACIAYARYIRCRDDASGQRKASFQCVVAMATIVLTMLLIASMILIEVLQLNSNTFEKDIQKGEETLNRAKKVKYSR